MLHFRSLLIAANVTIAAPINAFTATDRFGLHDPTSTPSAYDQQARAADTRLTPQPIDLLVAHGYGILVPMRTMFQMLRSTFGQW